MSRHPTYIEIQENVPGAADGFNEANDVWTKVCGAWARKRDTSDMERLQAGVELSVRLARFVTPYSPSLAQATSENRIVSEGAAWDILGVKELKDKPQRKLEFSVRRRSD